jgi:hypothetical protein
MLLNGLFDLHAQWIKPGLTPSAPGGRSVGARGHLGK